MCRRAVAWFLRKDGRGVFRAIAYQDAPVSLLTPQLRAACEQAIHVLMADGRILRAGRATLFILENVGWSTWAQMLALPPFIWLVEVGYKFVAGRRHLFSRFLFTQ